MSGARQARKARPAQRWPDLMVGALTLALLAGFGSLLLGERQRSLAAQTPPAQPAAPVIPSSPGTVPEPQPVTPPVATSPEPTTPPQTPNQAAGSEAVSGATPPATTTTSQALDPANSATAPTPATAPTATPSTATTPEAGTAPQTTTSGLAQTSEIPPVPQAPPVSPITPPVLPQTPTTAQQAPQTATTAEQPATPQTTAPVPARAGGAVATSENRVPLRSDYRISLGSFTTRKTVESQTGGVRGLGYTVHAIDLGDQYVAQIGPFANEEEARRALADIQRAYPSALLYRPRGAAASTPNGGAQTEADTGTASSAADTATSGASTTETTPARPQASAPSGPAYLQVGAFDREESAQRLVGILHDNGFNPTVNSPEGRKTTVMVGPYSGDALLRAEARLDNAGLDHFRVR